MTGISLVLFSMALLGLALNLLGVLCIWRVRSRTLPSGIRPLAISMIKPLCGLDDDLEENLRSHLHVDYEGEWEMVLGLRGEGDPAYPLAKDFATRNPKRVRLVLQEGEPGYNPKVNQLMTLTQAARYPVIAVTDSNIRVPRSFLREISDALQQPKAAIATHLFVGVGEKRLGAALDNLTLAGFAAPNLAGSTLLLGLDEVVGKSMAMTKEALAAVGGWQRVKDKLAEDQQLGLAFRALGLRTVLCPSPVENVQIHQPFGAFWSRQTRWLMIRYRTFFPGVLFEWIMLPSFLGLLGAFFSPRAAQAWTAWIICCVVSMALVQLSARILRQRGFRLTHLLLNPVREAIYFFAWIRGAMLRKVVWRGNSLYVLNQTRLVPAAALQRAPRQQKLSRS